jgi:hypothetical protein
VLTVGLALALGWAGCGGGEPERASSVPADEVVERLAPLVHVARGETAYPMAAGEFIDHARLLWWNGYEQYTTHGTGKDRVGFDTEVGPIMREHRVGAPARYRHPSHGRTFTTTDLTRPFTRGRSPALGDREGFVLDLLTRWMPGQHTLTRDGDVRVLDGLPVYAETARRPNGLRITYWMLFGQHVVPSRSFGSHEGDWERVSVDVRRDGGDYAPVEVRYHQDGATRETPWERAAVSAGPDGSSASHPVVRLTKGEHTPQPGTCEGCPQWRTWERVLDAREQPWYGFGGAWGLIGVDAESTGPVGPSRFVAD